MTSTQEIEKPPMDSLFPAFNRSLPMALMRAREAVMKKFMPVLNQYELTAQQWRVMRALQDQGKLDISELSERCYLLKPSLSRIIQNLEKRDIIKRTQDQADQRRSFISLTTHGRTLFSRILPLSEAAYAHIAEIFGYGKLQLLHELLDELTQKMNDTALPDELNGHVD